MKIDSVVITHVRVPLLEPFKISSGSVSEKDAIVVALYSEGLVGYGEASPMSGSFYSEDTPESTWDYLSQKLIPEFLKAKFDSLDELNAWLDKVGGTPFARAGLETAAWDLAAKGENRPILALLGAEKTVIESGLAVGIYPSIEILLKRLDDYLSEGYKRIKIKIQKGWDVEPLMAVRRFFGDVPLMVDANCAYDRSDIEHLKKLDEFGLMMIEQPLKKNDLEGHAILQEAIGTPVCLDESADTPASVKKAIELGSCKIVNVKLQRVGGFGNARIIHDLCVAAGLRLWAGTMPELGIGGIHALFLSSLPGFSFPTDVESSARWFTEDIVVPKLKVDNGCFKLSEYASYDIDLDVVNRNKVRELRLS